MSPPSSPAVSQDLAIVLHTLGDGLLITDGTTGEVVFVNERAARFSGFSSAAEMLATPAEERRRRVRLMDERGHLIPVEERIDRRALQGEGPSSAELRMRSTQTGEELWCEVTTIPLMESGRVRQVVTAFRDITRQRRAARTLRFLSEATAALSESLDYRTTLEVIVNRVVPALADTCTVDVLQEDGRLQRVSADSDPKRAERLRELRERFPLSRDNFRGPAHVLLTGKPFFSKSLSDEELRPLARSDEELRLFKEIGYRQVMMVPLSARGRILGVLTLALAGPERHFDEEDLALATELGSRAALALDNARLYQEAQAAARQYDEERQRARDAEARSRESEERLRMALDAGRMGHFDLDLATNTGFVAPFIQDLLGFAPREFDGTLASFIARIHPEDLPRLLQEAEALVRGGTSAVFEYRVIRPDGSVRWIESHTRVVRDEAGKALRRVGVMVDVTARHAAEEHALRLAAEQAARAEAESSERRTAAILESIWDPLFALDAGGRLRFLNRRAEQMANLTREQALGRQALELFPSERARAILERCLASARAGQAAELEEQLDTGVWLELCACAFDGGLSISVRDITDRKRERAAEARRAQYEALRADVSTALGATAPLAETLRRCAEAIVVHLDASVVSFWLLNAEGTALERVARAGPSPGLTEAAHVPIDHPDLGRVLKEGRAYVTNDLPRSDRFDRQEWVREHGLTALAGYPLMRGDTQLGMMAIFARHAFPEHLQPALGAIADTIAQGIARKRAEEALAERAAELARSNAELEQFAYVASHDLKEPLRMVSSYTQLLARRYRGKLDADADEFIKFAVDGANRMQRLISDLLTYSRVGTRAKALAPVQASDVLERALANLQAVIDEQAAELSVTPLPQVMGDEIQLEQLFQNLVGNALKFHGAAPPRVEISAEPRGAEWVFSVKDNGIGIDPAHFSRLFVIFQRLHDREQYPGTGIGLAVCKKIVERHGGRIWVESSPGQGATFHFTLPLAPPSRGEPG